MNWIALSASAGFVFALGIIQTNKLTSLGIPVNQTMFTLGITWMLLSLPWILKEGLVVLNWQHFLMAVGSAVLFWMGNQLQFHSFAVADNAGHAVLIVTAVNFTCLFLSDLLTCYRNTGSVKLSVIEVVAICLVFSGITMFSFKQELERFFP